MKGRKRVYRVMWEDKQGIRDGKSGKIRYHSRPKGKKERRKKR